MQEENTNKTEEEKEVLAQNNSSTPIDIIEAIPTEAKDVFATENITAETDPIQEAYNEASYDLKKYLSGEEFPRTVELITQANRVHDEAESEINFICLMLALKIIKYDKDTGESVMSMLSAVGLDLHTSSQVWSDIETYIIPAIPELGISEQESVGDMTVNRSVTIDPQTEGAHITHFGPDSVEMRLKSVGAPRITLDQLSKGVSLLSGVNANIDPNNTRPRVAMINKKINYKSHLDPYRELVDEVQ